MFVLGSADALPFWLGVSNDIASALAWVNATYETHRVLFESASDLVSNLNSHPFAKVLAVVGFVAIAFPKKLSDIAKFYQYAMKRDPLPAYRAGGVKDDHIVMARRILFFYVLFLSYQIFQFPYSLANLDRAFFYVDIVFQSGLLIMLWTAYSQLKLSIRTRWDGQAEKQKAVLDWLSKKLDGMNVKPGQLRALAMSVFVGSFMPAFVIALPQLLQGVVEFNELVIRRIES